MNQGIAIAKTAGLGGDGDGVKLPAMENAARNARNDFIGQLDALHPGGPADQRRRVSAGEHQGCGRRRGDEMAEVFDGDQATGDAEDRVLAASQRVANRFLRGGEHGRPLGQQGSLLGDGHGVIASDAEQRGAGARGRRVTGAAG